MSVIPIFGMSKFYYSGIGSRSVLRPSMPRVWRCMNKVAECLSEHAILRSGGAEGADWAFEYGAIINGGEMEIYLPWNGFNGKWENREDGYYLIDDHTFEEAMKIAQEFHPNWNGLSNGARLLMARNTYQVLGQDLKTPSYCVICYTEGGKGGGGTGQALRIARSPQYNIPVLDLGAGDYSTQEVLDWISSL